MRQICMVAVLLCATPTQAQELCSQIYANNDFTFVVYSDGDTLRFNGEILGMRGCGTGLACSFRLDEKGQKVPAEFYYDGTSTDDAMVYIHPSLGEIRLTLICPEES